MIALIQRGGTRQIHSAMITIQKFVSVQILITDVFALPPPKTCRRRSLRSWHLYLNRAELTENPIGFESALSLLIRPAEFSSLELEVCLLVSMAAVIANQDAHPHTY